MICPKCGNEITSFYTDTGADIELHHILTGKVYAFCWGVDGQTHSEYCARVKLCADQD